jgi:predicted transglutaminase-like cysteine proteinase
MIQQQSAPPAASDQNAANSTTTQNQTSEPPKNDAPKGAINAVNDQITDSVTQANERPAWLPEKFKSPEDLAKSYGELESWRGKKEEELAATLLKDRPEAADKYELPKFESGNVDHDALAAHPLVGWWRDQAYKRGLSNDEFKAGVEQYVNALTANLPKAEEEVKKLGENATARLERVNAWVNATFTDPEEFAAVQQIGATATGIKALERVMKAAGGTVDVNTGDAGRTPDDSEAEIKKLMESKAYWHPADRDPKVVERVEKFFANKYRK